ncbi:hypothetical protein ACIRS1_31170 [Kitasatospora sp. NPDC101176]|uniref:hypothetical protein n=1 Tax=Kitasatospora sp. NPDC101176 TaxID=3364099 RepID=UPI003809F16C
MGKPGFGSVLVGGPYEVCLSHHGLARAGPPAGLLGFKPQGFPDGWAPVFVFAVIFAIAKGCTVFLPTSTEEHHERSGDPKEVMVGAPADGGRSPPSTVTADRGCRRAPAVRWCRYPTTAGVRGASGVAFGW